MSEKTSKHDIAASSRFLTKGTVLILAAVLMLSAWAAPVQAVPTNAPVIGEIERLILDDPANIYSGGKIVIGGVTVILPKNLLIDLPANRLSLQQIFKQAPAGCVATGESGLAKADTCNASGTGGFATLTAVRSNAGDIIAGDVLIEKGKEAVTGMVTFINYTDGYFRVNGVMNDSLTGVMVRLNDPDAVHTIQQGTGCAGGPNCSADPRFMLDGENYVIAFSTGYPVCIPSTVARAHPAFPAVNGVTAIAAGTGQANGDGTNDILCPSTNRSPAQLNEPPVADSRRFAPIVLGDTVTAEGNFETISGVKFLSTHTMRVNKALGTRNSPDQPDYLFLEEVFIEAPAFQNQRARAMWIGFTTLAPTDVDIWSIHRDPATNAVHEIPLASVIGCDAANGAGTCSSQGLVNAGVNIFRIRYDVDFLMARSGFPGGTKDAKLSPCLQIRANPRWAGLNLCGPDGATLANNWAVMSPVPHEIQARTGHLIQNPGLTNVTIDVSGHTATNGQYLFPLGINLGGLEVAEMTEIDLNLLFTPTIFEGIPWNLDRRLGPSGCLDNAGNPILCPAGPPIPLDPFPYTGLDPREQSNFLVAGLPGGLPTGSFSTQSFTQSLLSNVRNRIFSYADATGKPNGNATVLPYVLGSFPADPPLQPAGAPILPLTLACRAGGFGPVADEDEAVTKLNTALPAINVLFNDVAPLGAINFASVTIATPASHGTATANLDGTVSYAPATGFSGIDTFTYTVAETTTGALSNIATVTITVIGPPNAVSDLATTNKDVPVVVPVLINDSSLFGTIDVASILTGTQGANGTTTKNTNGTITYTPNAGFFGSDTFTYTVADTFGNRSNAATVTVIVNDVNTPPLALNDSGTTNLNTAVAINVVANDSAFGAIISAATVTTTGVVTPIGSGTVSAGPGLGELTFTPALDFSGLAAFTYTVQDSLGRTSNAATVFVAVNHRPVANAQAVSTLEDTALPIVLVGSDPEGTPVTYAIASQPVNGGTLSFLGQNVTYTPAANYNGPDSFTFTVSDGVLTSVPATVSITVTPVNDPPVANNQIVTTNEDAVLPVTLTAIDPDPLDTLTYTVVTQPLHGVLSGTAPNLAYTPALNFNGPDSVAFIVSDGTSTTAPATISITVVAVNDAPIVGNDIATTTINTAMIISVLANDTDVDGTINAASVLATTPTANGGTTSVNLNGTVNYAPAAGFSGPDTFTYTVADNLGLRSASATVTVTVAGTTETVAVALAQFRTTGPGIGDWRVEGTATPNTTVSIRVGNDLLGPLVGTQLVDAAGKWKFAPIGSTVLPGPSNTISVVTTGGATRLAFPVAVR